MARKTDDKQAKKDPQSLVGPFEEAYRRNLFDLDKTAKDLNGQGITSITHGQWAKEGARTFCKRYLLSLYEEGQAHKAKLPADKQKATKPTRKANDGHAIESGTVTPPEIPISNQAPTSEPQGEYQGRTNMLPGVDMEAVSKLVELYQSGKLTDMVNWYEATKEQTRMMDNAGIMASRPMFRSDNRVNTGIMISKTVRDKAMEKAQGEPGRVGKSLSQLTEFLLWEYAGRPTDALMPTAETPEPSDA